MITNLLKTIGLVTILAGSFHVTAAPYIVQPVAVTAGSVYDEGQTTSAPENTINGNGLDVLVPLPTGAPIPTEWPAHTIDNRGVSWHADAFPASPLTITFELGNDYQLTGMHLWNMNQYPVTGRGLKTATVSVSSDGTNFTEVPVGGRDSNGYFRQAVGEYGYRGEDYTFVAEAKWVRFSITSNWNDNLQYAGLSEVRFITVQPWNTNTLPPGLISWWNADNNTLDVTGLNPASSSGQTYAPGRFGQAFHFDGINQSVAAPGSASLDQWTQFTLEAWMKLDLTADPINDAPGRMVINRVGRADDQVNYNQGYQWGFWNNARNLVLAFNTNGQAWPGIYTEAILPAPMPTNVWLHYAATYDHNAVKLYLNGVPLKTNVIGAATVAHSTSSFRIGMDDNGNCPFPGSIDDVRVYSRALNAAEIDYLYQGPPWPGTYLRFEADANGPVTNQQSALQLADSSGNRIDGTVVGNTLPLNYSANVGIAKLSGNGLTNQFSLAFDGVEDAVSLGTAAGLEFSSALTLECSICPSNTTKIMNLISKWLPHNQVAWVLNLNTADPNNPQAGTIPGLIAFLVSRTGGDTDSALNQVVSNYRVKANEWTHLAAVFDGATLKLYVNGQLDATAPASGSIYHPSGAIVYLGHAQDGSPAAVNRFQGLMDEVRITGAALTPDQFLYQPIPRPLLRITEATANGIGGMQVGLTLTNLWAKPNFAATIERAEGLAGPWLPVWSAPILSPTTNVIQTSTTAESAGFYRIKMQ